MKQILACFGCWSQSSSPLSQIFGENGLRNINFNWGWGKTTEISWIIMSYQVIISLILQVSKCHHDDDHVFWYGLAHGFGMMNLGPLPPSPQNSNKKQQTRWGFVGCLSIVHQCRSHGAQIYVNQGSLDHQFWKDCNSQRIPLYLDLFNGDLSFLPW